MCEEVLITDGFELETQWRRGANKHDVTVIEDYTSMGLNNKYWSEID